MGEPYDTTTPPASEDTLGDMIEAMGECDRNSECPLPLGHDGACDPWGFVERYGDDEG